MPAVTQRPKPHAPSMGAAAAPAAPISKPGKGAKPAVEAEILFQKYFKSVGPRTYAAQMKRAGNGNHFLVLTEGRRDEKTGEVRKNRCLIFSEDFVEFFKMLHKTAQFIREHPVPEEVRQQRARFWAGKGRPKSPALTA